MRFAAAAAALVVLGASGVAHAERIERCVAPPLGARATIALPANPSTGYSWSVTEPPDGKYAAIVSENFIAPKTTMPGAAGSYELVVRGIARGMATIRLAYARAHAAGNAGTTAEITVLIDGTCRNPNQR